MASQRKQIEINENQLAVCNLKKQSLKQTFTSVKGGVSLKDSEETLLQGEFKQSLLFILKTFVQYQKSFFISIYIGYLN